MVKLLVYTVKLHYSDAFRLCYKQYTTAKVFLRHFGSTAVVSRTENCPQETGSTVLSGQSPCGNVLTSGDLADAKCPCLRSVYRWCSRCCSSTVTLTVSGRVPAVSRALCSVSPFATVTATCCLCSPTSAPSARPTTWPTWTPSWRQPSPTTTRRPTGGGG